MIFPHMNDEHKSNADDAAFDIMSRLGAARRARSKKLRGPS
jgi:hypothetical protein